MIDEAPQWWARAADASTENWTAKHINYDKCLLCGHHKQQNSGRQNFSPTLVIMLVRAFRACSIPKAPIHIRRCNALLCDLLCAYALRIRFAARRPLADADHSTWRTIGAREILVSGVPWRRRAPAPQPLWRMLMVSVFVAKAHFSWHVLVLYSYCKLTILSTILLVLYTSIHKYLCCSLVIYSSFLGY